MSAYSVPSLCMVQKFWCWKKSFENCSVKFPFRILLSIFLWILTVQELAPREWKKCMKLSVPQTATIELNIGWGERSSDFYQSSRFKSHILEVAPIKLPRGESWTKTFQNQQLFQSEVAIKQSHHRCHTSDQHEDKCAEHMFQTDKWNLTYYI